MSQSNDLPPLRSWISLDRLGSATIGPKGQIVIPKAMRGRVGMKPGGKVFIDQDDEGAIRLRFAWNDTISGPPDYFAKFPVLPGMEGKTSLDILHEMDAEDEEIDLELAARAGWLKLRGGIAYADCFAAALAHRDGIPVITGDREFRRVEDVVQIAWLDSFD